MGLLLRNEHNYSSYISTGLEVKTFARVYVNLELLVNEEFIAYGTMVKILAISKSPSAKECYLIQKLEPAIGRVYLPQSFGNNFFLHNLICWRYEGFKGLVSIRNRKYALRMGHLFFKAFIYSASQIMKEKIYCQNIEANRPI